MDSKTMTPEALIELACRNYGLGSVSPKAFQHQNMSAEILAQLSQTDIELVKVAVAKHPKTTVATLKYLAKDENRFIRKAITQRNNIPQEIITILADDSLESIRLLVARMKNLTSETIIKLANDSSKSVRELIAKVENLAPETVTSLANDSSESVRELIAARTNLTPEMITQLFNDSNESVRCKIIKHHLKELNPENLLQLAQDPDEAFRCDLLESNHHLIDFIPEILFQLAQDKSEFVRSHVAYYQKLSAELIEMFAFDNSLRVRHALIYDRNYYQSYYGANSHLPLGILWKMLEQNEASPDLKTSPPLTRVFHVGNQEVSVRDHEILSERVVNFYLKIAIAKHPNTPLDFLHTLIKDEDDQIQAAALSSPKLSPITLDKFIDNDSKRVRFAVLDNPSVSSDALRDYLERNKGIRMCIGGGIHKARQNLKKRQSNL